MLSTCLPVRLSQSAATGRVHSGSIRLQQATLHPLAGLVRSVSHGLLCYRRAQHTEFKIVTRVVT